MNVEVLIFPSSGYPLLRGCKDVLTMMADQRLPLILVATKSFNLGT